MKKQLLILLAATSLFAADYNEMTLEELLSAKGTVPVEERTDFQSAMQDKMQSLTPEERAEIGVGRSGSSLNGTGQQLRDGSGMGGMHRGGRH